MLSCIVTLLLLLLFGINAKWRAVFFSLSYLKHAATTEYSILPPEAEILTLIPKTNAMSIWTAIAAENYMWTRSAPNAMFQHQPHSLGGKKHQLPACFALQLWSR